jgi:hypothetical protein
MDENKDFDSFIYELKEESIRKKIILIELLSIILTLISCIVSGYFWVTSGSMVAMAVSADSFLDILAYLTIIWRYFKPSDLNSTKRDIAAQIVISILLCAYSHIHEFESFKKFLLIIKPKPNYSFILTSVFQSIIFSFISIIKFKLCKNLKLNFMFVCIGSQFFDGCIWTFLHGFKHEYFCL